jgi:hypothetical protein
MEECSVGELFPVVYVALGIIEATHTFEKPEPVEKLKEPSYVAPWSAVGHKPVRCRGRKGWRDRAA